MYDVLIIGAGPAGSKAGLSCAGQGLNVCMIEENDKVGEPIHCGECVSKLCIDKFDFNLPSEVISKVVKGIRVIFPGEHNCILHEDGYVLEKELFEQWLATKAQNAGVELKLKTKALSITKINDGYVVKTNNGNISARLVVDASGVTQFASRELKINTNSEKIMGLQYLMEDIPNDGYLDFYMLPKYAPGGYLWVIPKSNGRANVGLVTTEVSKIKSNLDDFIKLKGWAKNTNLKTFGGLIPSSGPFKTTVHDNLVMVGDSAGFTSPLFEGGTHAALASATFASNVISKAFKHNDLSRNSLLEYEKVWKSKFPVYSNIIKGKDALYKFSSDELEMIGSCLPNNFDNFNNVDKMTVGMKILQKNPLLYGKGVVDALVSLGYSTASQYGW